MYGVKKRGRQWNGWITDVEEDFRQVGTLLWRVKALDRLDWRRTARDDAKVHAGLQRRIDDVDDDDNSYSIIACD